MSWTNDGGKANPDPVTWYNGAKGEKGDTGETGPQGPQGEQGPTGATGPQGPTGPQGEKGSQGAQGPTGAQGEKGETGPQGPTGATGPQGETGPQGPQGIQGEKGEKGDTGETGPEGPQGPTGPTGAQGNDGATGTTFTPSLSTDTTTTPNTYTLSWTNDGGKTNPNAVTWRDGKDGSGGSSGGGLIPCDANKEDVRIVTMTSNVVVYSNVYYYSFDIADDGTISVTSSSSQKQIRLYTGQRIIFVRWYSTSSSNNFISVAPVSGSSGWLMYTQGAPTTFKTLYHGLIYTSETSYWMVQSNISSITSGSISSNSTSEYYKFASS